MADGSTPLPYTEADVEAMAKVVAEAFGDRELSWPDFVPESRAILRLLAGRLLPEGAKPCTFLEPGGCSGECQAGRGCQGDGTTYYTGDEVMQLIRSRDALRESLADCVVKATRIRRPGRRLRSELHPAHRAYPPRYAVARRRGRDRAAGLRRQEGATDSRSGKGAPQWLTTSARRALRSSSPS